MNPQLSIIGVGFVFYLGTVYGKTIPYGKNVPPESGLAYTRSHIIRGEKGVKYAHPTSILVSDLHRRYSYHRDCRQKDYRWRNHPIFAFGLENFLSYAAHFCKYESENGALEVVSVGSGNGTIENDIIEAHANHFGGELNITLVDPDPKCRRVDFRTVDDLLAERANVVRNCVPFVIWPESIGTSDGYDIQAIRKLQPRAVLTMYEMTGISGSAEFIECLRPPGPGAVRVDGECDPELDNYLIENIAYKNVFQDPDSADADKEMDWIDEGDWKFPAYEFRMAKLIRTD